MNCKHEDYDVKIVMDFTFCVCKTCGFQWAGREPYDEVELPYSGTGG